MTTDSTLDMDASGSLSFFIADTLNLPNWIWVHRNIYSLHCRCTRCIELGISDIEEQAYSSCRCLNFPKWVIHNIGKYISYSCRCFNLLKMIIYSVEKLLNQHPRCTHHIKITFQASKEFLFLPIDACLKICYDLLFCFFCRLYCLGFFYCISRCIAAT